jgi:4'-phosphopantetheinyl transferase
MSQASQEPHIRSQASDVHVWYCSTDILARPGVRAVCDALMNPQERARHDRFMAARVRDEFLLTRGLCRSVLSHHTGVSPADWTFVNNAYGRPQIDAPKMAVPLHFNLSNTTGLVACAVTQLGYEVGIDVEDSTRTCEMLALAERNFAPDEAAHVRALSGEAQRRAFFAFWTLKEAYIKARGLGLSISLDAFSIAVDRTPPSIAFTAGISDDAAAWQLALHTPTPRHLLAVAVKRGLRPDVQVHMHEGLPGY